MRLKNEDRYGDASFRLLVPLLLLLLHLSHRKPTFRHSSIIRSSTS